MLIKTLNQFRQFAQDFNWECFCLDTETTSLDWFELDIESIQLYDGQKACFIDLVNNSERDKILKDFYYEIKRVKTIIGHYLTFDFEVLAKFIGLDKINEVMCRVNIIDTQVASHLIDERESSKLKGDGSCCERFLNRKAVEYDEVKDLPRDSQEFIDYGIADVVNTWDLWQVQEPIIKEQGLVQVFRIDCNFIPVKIEMELTGVLIDQDLLKRMEYDLDTMKCDLEEQILNVLGKNPLNQSYFFETPIEELGLNSPKKMIQLIKEKIGIELTNTSNEILVKYQDKHPFFKLLRKYRAAQTLLSRYATPYWGLIQPDGRIHTKFHTLVSGREQATKPNLENQAKENDLIPEINIRELFIASPGRKYLRIDYSGQELRLAAHNCNDQNMIKAFENDWDVHLYVANQILNLEIWNDYLCEKHPKYKEVKEYFDTERTKFKSVNFGIIYGKHHTTFAKEWNVPFWEAYNTLDGFFQMFPDIKKGIDNCKEFMDKHGYAVTGLGRRRRFTPPLKQFDYRAGFNHTCQGFGADIGKKAARDIWSWKLINAPYVKLVLWVHDEMIFEIDEDKVEAVKESICNMMCNTVKLRCPLKVDAKIRNSYGDKGD